MFMNIALIAGVLTADARMSVLPDESAVHNFELRTECGGERHVVPVAWYGAKRPPRLLAGDEVVVAGMIRRRWFRAGGGSQSRTEVVAIGVAKPGSKGAARLLAAACADVSNADPARSPLGIPH